VTVVKYGSPGIVTRASWFCDIPTSIGDCKYPGLFISAVFDEELNQKSSILQAVWVFC
jgi:hypothetical protein